MIRLGPKCGAANPCLGLTKHESLILIQIQTMLDPIGNRIDTYFYSVLDPIGNKTDTYFYSNYALVIKIIIAFNSVIYNL